MVISDDYILHYNISSLFRLSAIQSIDPGIMHYMIRFKTCKIVCTEYRVSIRVIVRNLYLCKSK